MLTYVRMYIRMVRCSSVHVRSKQILIEEDLITRTEFVHPLRISSQQVSTVHTYIYSETSLIRHSMGPENNVGLGGCWIMECLLPYLCILTVPHIMVGLERCWISKVSLYV